MYFGSNFFALDQFLDNNFQLIGILILLIDPFKILFELSRVMNVQLFNS
jgi:hypothetical protein